MDLLLLTTAALAAATLSGAVGMGGGTVLVAAMASVLSPFLVVPLHGIVQLASNSTRSLLLVRHAEWSLVLLYVPAQIVGVLVAREVYSGSTLSWFRPTIGAFVLAYLLWDRVKPERLEVPRAVFALAGFGGGLLTILVGVSGPYLAAFFLRRDLSKEQIVATKALIQTVGHLAKIPVFLTLGFVYDDHLHLLLPLLGAALLGTWVGTRLLRRMSPGWFAVAFRALLAALGLRLILSAWL